MSLTLKPLMTTVLGGLVFLLPLIVVLTVVGQGLSLVAGLAAPLAALVPQAEIGGVAVVTLVALALVLSICYAAGLMARAAVGRALSEKFESRLHALYPRYTVIKAMTQGLVSEEGAQRLKPVLVTFDDHQLLAMEVERCADDRVVVFLPGAPDPWSGNVVVVAAARVAEVAADLSALNRSLKGLGRGSAALVDRPPRMAA